MKRTVPGSNPIFVFFCFPIMWLLSGSTLLNAQQPFITTWKPDNVVGSTSITIPTSGTGYNYEVDWNNDGTYDQSGITGSVTHNFGTAGTYTIRIRGTFPRFNMNSGAERLKLIDIVQWGDIAWTSMTTAFRGCANLNISATDVPNLSGVTSLQYMFGACTSLNSPANIGTWNTSTVTNMGDVFNGATLFNQPIGNWNTASVVTMASMFRDASSFNQPIGTWNTASLTTMFRMFEGAGAFDQPIGNWNTALVNNMSRVFYDAVSFNQPIGNWNTTAVTNMANMFNFATSFDQPLSNWNTAAVISMGSLFYGASVFNQPIGNWNTASVIDMSGMFLTAHAFNQPLSNWNTAAVTNMSSMFSSANAFDQPIGNWNTAAVTNMNGMFAGATSFNQPLANWDVSKVTNMDLMFQDANVFNQPIGNWNTSALTSAVQMFYGANLFNQPLANWDVSAVTQMNYMFSEANSFNQSLANWTLNPNVNLILMFSYGGLNCTNYSATLNGWAANPATPSGRSLGAHGRQYGTSAVAARTYLDIDKGWTFTSDVASGATCSLVLPVEWLSFSGEQSDRVIFLTWQTALETGNLGFQVERSTDGSHWQSIGFVPARRENENKPFYTFTDEKTLDEFPACRTLYYRLRQMDQDGGEDFSKILNIKITGAAGQSDIRVFPNPVSNGALTLVLPETAKDGVNVRLMNSTGEVLRSAVLDAGTHTWDVRDLAPGIYFVAAEGSTGRFFEKVMIQ